MVPKRVRLKEQAPRGKDRLTHWRRYFAAALAETPILGSNHEAYARHLRQARAQQTKNHDDPAGPTIDTLLQKES